MQQDSKVISNTFRVVLAFMLVTGISAFIAFAPLKPKEVPGEPTVNISLPVGVFNRLIYDVDTARSFFERSPCVPGNTAVQLHGSMMDVLITLQNSARLDTIPKQDSIHHKK